MENLNMKMALIMHGGEYNITISGGPFNAGIVSAKTASEALFKLAIEVEKLEQRNGI